MTCIVAVTNGKYVAMAGDRLLANESLKVHSAVPKIMDKNGVLIGTCGCMSPVSFREKFVIGPVGEHTPTSYMVNEFIPKYRHYMKDTGIVWEENIQRITRACLLVGVRNCVYEVHHDFHFQEIQGYRAIGSGDSIALGALHATRSLTPERSALAAVKAACYHSPSVGGEIDILTTRKDA